MEQQANTAIAAIEAPDIVVAIDSNIISFPHRHQGDPQTHEQAQQMIDAVRSELSEEVADEQFEALMAIARNYGIHTREERCHHKDWFFIREMLVAMNMRYYGIDHNLQRIPDEAITIQPLDHEDPNVATDADTGDDEKE